MLRSLFLHTKPRILRKRRDRKIQTVSRHIIRLRQSSDAVNIEPEVIKH